MPLNDVPPPKPKAKGIGRPRKLLRPTINELAKESRQEIKDAEKQKKYLDSLRKLEKIQEGRGDKTATAIVTPDELKTYQEFYPTGKQEVVFEPNPGPQTEFLASSEREVLFGGSRGGSKSYGLLVDPLRYCMHSIHRALILRKTIPELRDMLFKANYLYKKAFPGTNYNKTENVFYFPSGARIEFGYAENLNDATRYQGQSYTWIGVDEVAQYPTSEILDLLRASLRSVDPKNVPIQLRLTANPGNVGSDWLREQFVDPAPPNTMFEVFVKIRLPRGNVITERITRKFIPATVWDNPYLLQDMSYVTMLANLPEVKRKQWLEGNWWVQEDAAFPEFDRDIHVVDPFALPSNWVRFRGCDWGYATPGCCLWFAANSATKQLVCYREMYFKGLTAPQAADRIRELEENENVLYGVLDVSAFMRRGEPGDSIGTIMNKMGLRWRPSGRVVAQGVRTSRISGKLEVHRRLSLDGITKKPQLVIFKNCTNLIKTMSAITIDKNDPEDVDTNSPLDHPYDALRYACQSRPLNIGGLLVDRNNPGFRTTFNPSDPIFGY